MLRGENFIYPAALLLSSVVASHTCAAVILFSILQHPDEYRRYDINTDEHLRLPYLFCNSLPPSGVFTFYFWIFTPDSRL